MSQQNINRNALFIINNALPARINKLILVIYIKINNKTFLRCTDKKINIVDFDPNLFSVFAENQNIKENKFINCYYED